MLSYCYSFSYQFTRYLDNHYLCFLNWTFQVFIAVIFFAITRYAGILYSVYQDSTYDLTLTYHIKQLREFFKFGLKNTSWILKSYAFTIIPHTEKIQDIFFPNKNGKNFFLLNYDLNMESNVN